MKVKCPRCGFKGEIVDNKCPICEFPLESTASKPFNKNVYITLILILLVIIACLTYLYWNNKSSSEAEKVAIQKQFDAEKEAATKAATAKMNAEQKTVRDNNVRPDVKSNTPDRNNSSNSNIINQLNKLDELKKQIDEHSLCMRLNQESGNTSTESIALLERQQKLSSREVDIMRDCARNNSPPSVWRERTQYVRDKIKELDIELSLLNKKQNKILQEIKINNCR